MSKLCVDLFLATNCKWFNVEANNSQDAVWIIKIINFIAGWELLKDPAGRDHFLSFLEKEYATENLLFVESVWHLKKLPVSEVKRKSYWNDRNNQCKYFKKVGEECSIIWSKFMASQAEHPVNVDSKSYKITQENMNNPDRWPTFYC